MPAKEIKTYYPKTQQDWRKWLEKNHLRHDSVWVKLYKKGSNKPTINWREAVDEALCFGWIDSIKKTLDDQCSIQFFSKRKPNGTWSKINKEKIEQLIADGKMTSTGMAYIDAAKKNGSWSLLDEVEALIIPKDLEKAFKLNKGSKKYFQALNKSTQKNMLKWIALARQPQTRERRILEIAESAANGERPKLFV
jgi:uncharacterized protein YdeI (YjbR/CyaY-like superfamily)